MSRPQKEGLDYFPLDVDMDIDDKMFMVQADYDLLGVMYVIKILMMLYKGGYYLCWTPKKEKLFATKNKLKLEMLHGVVKICLEENFFNQDLFNKYNILTSNGIQIRYFEATKRRYDLKVFEEYLLIPFSEIKNKNKKLINVGKNSLKRNNNSDTPGVNASKNSEGAGVNDSNNPQRKGKERKGKEIIKKEDQKLNIHKDIIACLNSTCGKKIKLESGHNIKKISDRLAQGYTFEDFKTVIEYKNKDWPIGKMFKSKDGEQKAARCYLHPDTLFSNKNFDKYLNEALAANQPKTPTSEEPKTDYFTEIFKKDLEQAERKRKFDAEAMKRARKKLDNPKSYAENNKHL